MRCRRCQTKCSRIPGENGGWTPWCRYHGIAGFPRDAQGVPRNPEVECTPVDVEATSEPRRPFQGHRRIPVAWRSEPSRK